MITYTPDWFDISTLPYKEALDAWYAAKLWRKADTAAAGPSKPGTGGPITMQRLGITEGYWNLEYQIGIGACTLSKPRVQYLLCCLNQTEPSRSNPSLAARPCIPPSATRPRST